MRQHLHARRHELFPAFDLNVAIDERRLVLHYQPIVDLENGRLFAVEALVRWLHPAYGLMAPTTFLPAITEAEDHRLLDLWVLQTASQELRAICAPETLQLSINVSPTHIDDTDSIAELACAIQDGILDPQRIVLELTENAALRDTKRAIEAVLQLKALGVHFAIDDFGTGFASLDYLARLPADYLKIDRGFIGHYGDDKHAAIIRSVVSLAGRLRIGVIMEGIEREDQLVFARSCRTGFGQGYLFSEPLPIADLERLLETPAGHRTAVS